MRAHLFADVSAHGYGHLAQTAPVVNALRARQPELRVSLRGEFPRELLNARLHGPIDIIAGAADCGMQMGSALDVQREQSAAAYRHFHSDWERRIADEAALLRRLRPDLVLTNIGYTSLAAAAVVGIPAIAMSSLNWAAILDHYCHELPGCEAIVQQMLGAYRSAGAFLRLSPGLPMDDLPNRRIVGPVAGLGRNRREEVRRLIGIGDHVRIVLVALGGIATRVPVETWRRASDICWIIPNEWQLADNPPSWVELQRLHVSFADALCSADAVITKPGYGTFVEAACAGVPVLYVKRNDWPEEPYLGAWLEANNRSLEIGREQLWTGDFQSELTSLLEQPVVSSRVEPSGIDEAADYLERQFNLR